MTTALQVRRTGSAADNPLKAVMTTAEGAMTQASLLVLRCWVLFHRWWAITSWLKFHYACFVLVCKSTSIWILMDTCLCSKRVLGFGSLREWQLSTGLMTATLLKVSCCNVVAPRWAPCCNAVPRLYCCGFVGCCLKRGDVIPGRYILRLQPPGWSETNRIYNEALRH